MRVNVHTKVILDKTPLWSIEGSYVLVMMFAFLVVRQPFYWRSLLLSLQEALADGHGKR